MLKITTKDYPGIYHVLEDGVFKGIEFFPRFGRAKYLGLKKGGLEIRGKKIRENGRDIGRFKSFLWAFPDHKRFSCNGMDFEIVEVRCDNNHLNFCLVKNGASVAKIECNPHGSLIFKEVPGWIKISNYDSWCFSACLIALFCLEKEIRPSENG